MVPKNYETVGPGSRGTDSETVPDTEQSKEEYSFWIFLKKNFFKFFAEKIKNFYLWFLSNYLIQNKGTWWKEQEIKRT